MSAKWLSFLTNPCYTMRTATRLLSPRFEMLSLCSSHGMVSYIILNFSAWLSQINTIYDRLFLHFKYASDKYHKPNIYLKRCGIFFEAIFEKRIS